MFKKLNLFSGSSLKVLQTLASDPAHSFFQREVAEAARVSVGSANRVLRRLVDAGLVEGSEKGKIHTYRFNADNPVTRQLKILFNLLELEVLIEQLKDHARRIILFGSCAEGRDVKESDVDLFILTNERDDVAEIIGRFDSARRLAPIIVDAEERVRLRDENKPLYEEIERGITLWERD